MPFTIHELTDEIEAIPTICWKLFSVLFIGLFYYLISVCYQRTKTQT